MMQQLPLEHYYEQAIRLIASGEIRTMSELGDRFPPISMLIWKKLAPDYVLQQEDGSFVLTEAGAVLVGLLG